MYYLRLPVPFTEATGENPGVAASTAILVSIIVAFLVMHFDRSELPEKGQES